MEKKIKVEWHQSSSDCEIHVCIFRREFCSMLFIFWIQAMILLAGYKLFDEGFFSSKAGEIATNNMYMY